MKLYYISQQTFKLALLDNFFIINLLIFGLWGFNPWYYSTFSSKMQILLFKGAFVCYNEMEKRNIFMKENREKKHFDVVILGAGAAGMMCAATIKGRSVAVVDMGGSLAKKLMVTGNGRCNLTNLSVSSKFYNRNIDQFLKRFDEKQTLKFFEKLGLVTYADEEGRVYPISNSAKSVVDVLNLAVKNKISAFLGEKVVDFKREKDEFVLSLKEVDLAAKSLVIATGGNSAELLSGLGVGFNKFVPSLVALSSNTTRELAGVRVSNVLVTATGRNGTTKTECGEVLFRENGLSGIAIFNISTMFARRNDFKGKISLDLLPDCKENELTQLIERRKKKSENLDKLFVGMFVPAIANEVFKQSKVNTNKPCEKLSESEAKLLAKTIKNLQFETNGHLDNNQVFCGGVPLEELDQNLMYKKTPNLYFVGEICDVDGECGGFNLQWAWTSGHIVGESLC